MTHRSFEFRRFADQVFAPETGERVLILVDEPTATVPANKAWQQRFEMAQQWHSQFAALGKERGFEVLPLLRFPAVADHHAPFPKEGRLGDDIVTIDEQLDQVSLAIAMTEISMTAGLVQAAMRRPGAENFRAASMPLACVEMQNACYDIDYALLQQRCQKLKQAFDQAIAAEVTFSTGHSCFFDLRHRQCGVDNGYLHRDKEGVALINMPSGEVWITPYEGEIEGDVSKTRGTIPVAAEDGSVALLTIEANRIVAVGGEGTARDFYESLFELDPMRRNVGEIAFGCNPDARVSGLYIEDEKAGFHWGFGRSDFLGGTVGVDQFIDETTVLHYDNPYAKACQITASAELITESGERIKVLENGEYLV
ncbi:aminopeptidase [Pseudomaricurvus alkylphenolicus]|uniref:aminopeptidase n=1 Tax=Pseudomaricurvus alkylphenolicus TaxID=1306991 RepID=UPI0014209796|nr:aminopeptidase [Pseudomaricurvus alkylphenolicus]NIB44897.1 aminopeptidase [Pseudomaricurvus alkylphenolicus]